MPKPGLDYVESMILRPCNLACSGCTTFSDLKWSGFISWQQGEQDLLPWLDRIEIKSWGVMGGEPLMHPELSQWLIGMRRLLPEARLRMVTNGLLLHRNWWLVDTLEDLGNSTLKITKHLDHAQLDENIKTVMHLRKWEPVYEYGIHRWKSPRGLRLQITQPTHFLKTFRNDYHDMMPHNNDPSLAFESCVQKKCPMLWQGRLYKCGTLALTPDLLEKFQWPNRNHWLPFIHHGLAPTASDSDIAEFVANFGEPHAMCRQCPSSQDRESWFDHKHTVTLKRNIKHLDSIQS